MTHTMLRRLTSWRCIIIIIMQSQLRWCGHVHRMPDSRIPKQLLYGQLADIARSQGGQRKRYKDHLRLTLKSCDISNSSWESIASDRLKWRHLCHSSLVQFENQRIASLDDRRTCRKNQASTSNPTVNTFSCMICGRTCTSQIGMYAHQKQCNSTSAMDSRSCATTSAGSTSTSSLETRSRCHTPQLGPPIAGVHSDSV